MKTERPIEGLHNAGVVRDATVVKGKRPVDREWAGTWVECDVMNRRAARNVRDSGRAEYRSFTLCIRDPFRHPISRRIPIAASRVNAPGERGMRQIGFAQTV